MSNNITLHYIGLFLHTNDTPNLGFVASVWASFYYTKNSTRQELKMRKGSNLAMGRKENFPDFEYAVKYEYALVWQLINGYP